jgi:hypothetical protein
MFGCLGPVSILSLYDISPFLILFSGPCTLIANKERIGEKKASIERKVDRKKEMLTTLFETHFIKTYQFIRPCAASCLEEEKKKLLGIWLDNLSYYTTYHAIYITDRQNHPGRPLAVHFST